MTARTRPATAWVLRSPCGCPHGASLIDHTIAEAWAELAGPEPEPTRLARADWTLTAEPADEAVADVRARLGKCAHVKATTQARGVPPC